MKKLKDLLYDKNDIVIAVLILAIAAAIIVWRLDVILQYPKQLVGNDDTNITEESDKPADSDDNDTADKPKDEDGKKPAASDDSQKEEASNQDDTSAVIWADGKLSKDVTVDVSGTTSSAAIGCLVNAGLFNDYNEYKALCDSAGLDHEKVSAGTFTFKAGTTKAQIARKMNWS